MKTVSSFAEKGSSAKCLIKGSSLKGPDCSYLITNLFLLVHLLLLPPVPQFFSYLSISLSSLLLPLPLQAPPPLLLLLPTFPPLPCPSIFFLPFFFFTFVSRFCHHHIFLLPRSHVKL